MFRLLKLPLLILIGATTSIPQVVSAGVIQETWYQMRSRANMKIENYAAAIEAYEKYLELKPNDREALKGIAVAYEKQGQTDKAIVRYDKYLDIYHDDAKIAFKQAEYLSWSRYAYRKTDAVKYLQMGLKVKDDSGQRLKYARLLAADKFDLERAVKQYEVLLQHDPDNQQLRTEFRNILLWDHRFMDKAIKQFEYYVARSPDAFSASKQLAELLAQTRNRKREGGKIYAQLLIKKPNDFKLRHDYARLLAETRGSFEQARRQYKILIDKKADYEILSETARLLQRHRKTHPEAIVIYNRMLVQRPRDTAVRMKRAALYMNQKSSASQALQDYRRVIVIKPQHSGAHQGAAKALAWLDQSDEALYHANLAKKYGKGDSGAVRLQDSLSRGREPRVVTLLDIPAQTGGNFKLNGTRLGLRFSGDLSPYTSTYVEIGTERFDSGASDASGTWWLVGGQYRINPSRKIDFEIGNHSVRAVGESQTLAVTYSDIEKYKPWAYSAVFSSSLVTDSFLSLVGDNISRLGGATRNEFFVSLENFQPSRRLSVRPSIGWIDSDSESANEFVAVAGSLDYPTDLITRFNTRLGVDASFLSYSKDHSGFNMSLSEPLSGGYFSPQTYLDVYLYADFTQSLDDKSELNFKLGPKLQYVDDATVAGEASGGFSGSISYTRKQTDSRFLILKAEHDSIGGRYRRTFLQAQMVFVF